MGPKSRPVRRRYVQYGGVKACLRHGEVLALPEILAYQFAPTGPGDGALRVCRNQGAHPGYGVRQHLQVQRQGIVLGTAVACHQVVAHPGQRGVDACQLELDVLHNHARLCFQPLPFKAHRTDAFVEQPVPAHGKQQQQQAHRAGPLTAVALLYPTQLRQFWQFRQFWQHGVVWLRLHFQLAKPVIWKSYSPASAQGGLGGLFWNIFSQQV